MCRSYFVGLMWRFQHDFEWKIFDAVFFVAIIKLTHNVSKPIDYKFKLFMECVLSLVNVSCSFGQTYKR